MPTEDRPIAKTLETPSNLPAAIDDIAIPAGEFCDVCGFGNLRSAQLTDAAGNTLHIEGPLDLLNLQGRIRRAAGMVISDYRCLIAKHTDNGIMVVGGRLTGGESSLLELTFTPLRADDAASVPKETNEKKAADAHWHRAIEVSATLEKQGSRSHLWNEEEPPLPAPGDTVCHRQFGDCRVVKLDDEHITLQKPDSRIVQLGLAVLQFRQRPGNSTVFDVSVRR